MEAIDTRDAALLNRPPNQPRLTRGQLRHALRLALIATSPQEQELVAYHFYHGLSFSEAAQRIGVGPARARELIAGLERRSKLIELSRIQPDADPAAANPNLLRQPS